MDPAPLDMTLPAPSQRATRDPYEAKPLSWAAEVHREALGTVGRCETDRNVLASALHDLGGVVGG